MAQHAALKIQLHPAGNYSASRRHRVAQFVDKEYSLSKVWQIMFLNFWRDFWKYPINSLWSIFYISVKKTAESLDKLGWSGPLHWVDHWPPGIKTAVQLHFEKEISYRILDLHNVELDASIIKKELKKHSLGTAVANNFVASFTAIVVGWILLGHWEFNVLNLINDLSHYFAVDRVAGGFLFGKDLGRAFYGIFKPEVHIFDIAMAIFVFMSFLTVTAFISTLIYFPIRQKLGFEEKKILKMVEEIENLLILARFR